MLTQFKSNQEHTPVAVVVAIDFGTSRTGYAYAVKTKPNEIVCEQQHEQVGAKEPTALLLQRKDLSFIAFGYDAQTLYEEASATERNAWYYFTKYKMVLYGADKDARKLTVSPENDPTQNISARIVMIASLQHLRHVATARIKEMNFQAEQIAWVLTVPAIWTPAGKAYMREVAIEAGFPGHRLRLSLESEAGALCAREHDKHSITSVTASKLNASEDTKARSANKVLVVDLGGGTADFTMHEFVHVNNTSRQIAPATGLAKGGTDIDTAFVDKILIRLFGASLWKELMQKYPQGRLHILRTFESVKDRLRLDEAEQKRSPFLRFPLPMEWVACLPKELYANKEGASLNWSVQMGQSHDVKSLLPQMELAKTVDCTKVEEAKHTQQLFSDPYERSPDEKSQNTGTTDTEEVDDFCLVDGHTSVKDNAKWLDNHFDAKGNDDKTAVVVKSLPLTEPVLVDAKAVAVATTTTTTTTTTPSTPSGIVFSLNTLKIPHKLLVDLYEETNVEIGAKIQEVLTQHATIGAVFLVGGFMRQPVVKEYLTRLIQTKFGIIPVVPPHPSNAIMRGAVMFGLRPEQILDRRLPFSIAVSVSITPSYHDYPRLKRERLAFAQNQTVIASAGVSSSAMISEVMHVMYKAGDRIREDGYEIQLREPTSSTETCNLAFYETQQTNTFLQEQFPTKSLGKISIDFDKLRQAKYSSTNTVRFVVRLDLKDTEFHVSLHQIYPHSSERHFIQHEKFEYLH